MTAHQSIDDLLAQVLRLEHDLEDEKRAHLAWIDCAVELQQLLDTAHNNVRALLAANEELQRAVKMLCRPSAAERIH